jgi:hypothetical protein
MEHHLHDPVIAPDTEIRSPEIGEAECQLSAESGINKTPSKKDPSPAIRGPAAQRSGKIFGELDPFQRRDKRTCPLFQRDISPGPEIV